MKTNNLKKGFLLLSVLILVFSCTKFEDLTENPNKSTSVPPSTLMSQILKSLSDNANEWSEQQRYNQFWTISFNYYGNQSYKWGAMKFSDDDKDGYGYQTLSNIVAMEKEAKKSDTYSNDAYGSMVKFLKAYFYDYLSKRVGDIPFGESLKATENVLKPKYNAQKEIYTAILDSLDASNTQIAKAIADGGHIDGDFYFRGDLKKWQKVINAFHLRMLISLSKKNAELGIADKINTIISNPTKYPLLKDSSDDMKRVFGNENGNRYTWNPSNIAANRNRNIIGATYVDLLKINKDPRIRIVADPAVHTSVILKIVKKDTTYAKYTKADSIIMKSYVGAKTGDAQGQMQRDSDKGFYSYPSKARYYSNYKGEPYVRIGYAEQEFNIAEAANRGWISEDAEKHYLNGIKASMKFYGVKDSDVATFLSNSNVVYKGGSDGLKQILTQKYIAFFNNSGMTSFFNQRRTGVPVFNVGPANKNDGKIPKRYKYPQGEYQNNTANLKAALDSQYGGADDYNAEMWMLK